MKLRLLAASLAALGLGAGVAVAQTAPAPAQQNLAPQAALPHLDELLSGVVRIKTYINPEGRTVPTLGEQRIGSGVVIDDSGLVVPPKLSPRRTERLTSESAVTCGARPKKPRRSPP